MNPARTNAIEQLPPDQTALLEHLARALAVLYGDRCRGLVLYGSHARGEANEGSDVDVLLLRADRRGEVFPA